MMIKSAQVVSNFEQWGWPQAVVTVGIALSAAFAVWCFFHYLSK